MDAAKRWERSSTHTLRVDGLTQQQLEGLMGQAESRGIRILPAASHLPGTDQGEAVVLLGNRVSLHELTLGLVTHHCLVSRAIAEVLAVLDHKVPVLHFRSGKLLLTGRAGVVLMGILNATPDSFSDGGRFTDPAAAIDHAQQMVDEGACIIDVGGESTRPGAEPVPLAKEMERTIPIVERLRERLPANVVLSVDTMKAPVARAAVDAGAEIINDVSAMTADPEMPRVAAQLGVYVILNHMRGTPKTMQEAPRYRHVIPEVIADLTRWITCATDAGVDLGKIIIDPGIGFGKRKQDNAAILRHLPAFVSLGRPVALGVSRKSFLGWLAPDAGETSAGRSESTLAAETCALLGGVHILRTHEPAQARRAAWVAGAVMGNMDALH